MVPSFWVEQLGLSRLWVSVRFVRARGAYCLKEEQLCGTPLRMSGLPSKIKQAVKTCSHIQCKREARCKISWRGPMKIPPPSRPKSLPGGCPAQQPKGAEPPPRPQRGPKAHVTTRKTHRVEAKVDAAGPNTSPMTSMGQAFTSHSTPEA